VKSDEIRTAFLKYFEGKGHKVIPSSSLIPKGDPTLLLTSAGMVQVKPYFLGEAKPPSRRLASCQKCFRTTDIESVGDASHLTFFEMLGNFSVGDYFKRETISWAFEFITQHLKIPPERLWVTVFLDDDDAFNHWLEMGIPEARIRRFGEEHNFWGPVGSSGPCGPDNEIFYDFGEETGCGKPDCQPNCECGRFVEISTLVFMQYNQDTDGRRSPLPRPSVDTGMGLERTTAILQGKASVYETDLFAPLLAFIAKLTGKKYGANAEDDTALRVVAEHGRALAFLIADGVNPSNEGRGYVLRHLLRRATLYGMRLGLAKPFLAGVADTAIAQMGQTYPELEKRRDFILKVIRLEESRFEETLKTGLEIIDELLAKHKKTKKISGADTFRLYDTYGFPVELTKEIVEKAGFGVDMAGFEKEMDKQRERGRAGLLRCAECGLRLKEPEKKCPNCGSMERTVGPINFVKKVDVAIGLTASVQVTHEIGKTNFVGYHTLSQEANIVKILVDGQEADIISEGQEAGIILDTTPFYAEMGGQVGDTGEIISKDGRFTVTDTVHPTPEVTLHRGKLATGSLKVRDTIEAVVNIDRRRDIARNHTATHLLQAALKAVLGEHIQQRGSLVAPERLRFDFSHLAAMTPDEIRQVQAIVNEKIRENLSVYDEETGYREAIAAGVTALFDEKYGDVVRVLSIGEPVISAELCGGTHVASTGEIGYFHIISESSIGAGLRRIEAVTGREAERLIEARLGGLEGIAQALEVTPETAPDKVSGLLGELDKERKRAAALEKDLARHDAEALLNQVAKIKNINVISARVTSGNQSILREMADFIRDKLGSAIVVLGAVSGERPVFIAAVTPDLVKKGYNAGDIVKKVAQVAGGGGGGRPDFAQAGGRDRGKLDAALGLVKDLV